MEMVGKTPVCVCVCVDAASVHASAHKMALVIHVLSRAPAAAWIGENYSFRSLI